MLHTFKVILFVFGIAVIATIVWILILAVIAYFQGEDF